MTAGWQTCFYAAALVLFALAALVAWAKHWGWPVLVAVGLACVTFVPLWSAAAAID